MSGNVDVERASELYLQGWTLAKIGEEYGVSRERIRQLLPQEVKDQAKAKRAEQQHAELESQLRAGWFFDEIAKESGLSLGTVSRLAYTQCREAWEEGEQERRERRTAETGPCVICGGLVADRAGAITCTPWCYEAYLHLRYRVNERARRAHRQATTRWHMAHREEPSEALIRTAETGETDEEHGRWFYPGSESLSWAAECVRLGYEPVIDALSEAEMAQVREHLGWEQPSDEATEAG